MSSNPEPIHYIPRRVWASESSTADDLVEDMNEKMQEVASAGFMIMEANIWPEVVGDGTTTAWFARLQWIEPCPVCQKTSHMEGPALGPLPGFLDFMRRQEEDNDGTPPQL